MKQMMNIVTHNTVKSVGASGISVKPPPSVQIHISYVRSMNDGNNIDFKFDFDCYRSHVAPPFQFRCDDRL